MRRFLSNHHNKMGLALLATLFMAQTVGAATGSSVAVPGVGQVPQWAVYVGLAMICPQDFNKALRTALNRMLGNETEGDG